MDYGKLLSRSFQVMWRYRALWVFGVLFALTGGSGGGNANFNFNFPGGASSTPSQPGSLPPQLTQPSEQVVQTIGIIIAAIFCFILIWIVLSIVLRMISRGALIGLVDELETNGAVPTVRHGFNIGADRFRSLLGIAFIVNIPLTLITLLLFACALSPVLIGILPAIASGKMVDQALVAFVGALFGSFFLICCVGLLVFAIQLVVHPFYEFIVRVCVTSKRAAMDSIREGYQMVRARVGNVVLLYLLIIGVGIGYTILMIPVVLILIGIPAAAAVLTYLGSHSTEGTIAVAVVLGIPMLLLLLLISGMYQVFEQTMWTEGYLALAHPDTAPARLQPLPPPPVTPAAVLPPVA